MRVYNIRIMATPSSPALADGLQDDVPSEQVKLEQPLGKTPEAFIELLTVAKLARLLSCRLTEAEKARLPISVYCVHGVGARKPQGL